LVFGCAYERIADGTCSATTLRDRRDEWIEEGAMDTLRELALEAYDRFVGLELPDVAVDCCIQRRPLAVARRPAEALSRQGKAGYQTLHGGGRKRHPPGHRHRCGKPPRLAAVDRDPRRGSTDAGRVAREYQHPSGSRLRLRDHPPAATRARSERRDLPEGQACPARAATKRWVVERTGSWHNAHKKLVWCTERCGRVVDFWVAFSEVIIIVRRLIREGWRRYRWEGRPSRRP